MLDFIRVDYELFKDNSIITLAYIVGLPIECILYCNEPYPRQTVVRQIQTIDQEKVQGNPFIVNQECEWGEWHEWHSRTNEENLYEDNVVWCSKKAPAMYYVANFILEDQINLCTYNVVSILNAICRTVVK